MNVLDKLRISNFILVILATVMIASVLPTSAGFTSTIDKIRHSRDRTAVLPSLRCAHTPVEGPRRT